MTNATAWAATPKVPMNWSVVTSDPAASPRAKAAAGSPPRSPNSIAQIAIGMTKRTSIASAASSPAMRRAKIAKKRTPARPVVSQPGIC